MNFSKVFLGTLSVILLLAAFKAYAAPLMGGFEIGSQIFPGSNVTDNLFPATHSNYVQGGYHQVSAVGLSDGSVPNSLLSISCKRRENGMMVYVNSSTNPEVYRLEDLTYTSGSNGLGCTNLLSATAFNISTNTTSSSGVWKLVGSLSGPNGGSGGTGSGTGSANADCDITGDCVQFAQPSLVYTYVRATGVNIFKPTPRCACDTGGSNVDCPSSFSATQNDPTQCYDWTTIGSVTYNLTSAPGQGFDLKGVGQFIWNDVAKFLQIEGSTGGTTIIDNGSISLDKDVLLSGVIDLDGATFDPLLQNSPVLGRGLIAYDNNSTSPNYGKLVVSENGTPYVPLLGGGTGTGGSKWNYIGNGNDIYPTNNGKVSVGLSTSTPYNVGILGNAGFLRTPGSNWGPGSSAVFESSSPSTTTQYNGNWTACGGSGQPTCPNLLTPASTDTHNNSLTVYQCSINQGGQTFKDVKTECFITPATKTPPPGQPQVIPFPISYNCADTNAGGFQSQVTVEATSGNLTGLQGQQLIGAATAATGTYAYNSYQYLAGGKTYAVQKYFNSGSCSANTAKYTIRGNSGDLEFLNSVDQRKITVTQDGQVSISPTGAPPTSIPVPQGLGFSTATAQLDVASGPTRLDQLSVTNEASVGRLIHFAGIGSGTPTDPDPAVSPAGAGVIYFDRSDSKFKVSEAGQVYKPLETAKWGEDLTNKRTWLLETTHNVGIGTTSPLSKLEVNGAIATAVKIICNASPCPGGTIFSGGPYPITNDDSVILAKGGLTVVLPPIQGTATKGRQYTIKKFDSSAFEVTIFPAVGSTDGIDGVVYPGNIKLEKQYDSITLVSNGNFLAPNWEVVSTAGVGDSRWEDVPGSTTGDIYNTDYSTGVVGIGTNNPTTGSTLKLHVEGIALTKGLFNMGGIYNTNGITNTDGSIVTNKLYLTGSGTPANRSAIQLGNRYAIGNIVGGFGIGDNFLQNGTDDTYLAGGAAVAARFSDTGGPTSTRSGQFDVKTAKFGSTGNAITWQTPLSVVDNTVTISNLTATDATITSLNVTGGLTGTGSPWTRDTANQKVHLTTGTDLVGVGTSTPIGKLQVNGTGDSRSLSDGGWFDTTDTTGSAYGTWKGWVEGAHQLFIKGSNSDNSKQQELLIGADQEKGIGYISTIRSVGPNQYSAKLVLTPPVGAANQWGNGGQVGIGTFNPTQALTIGEDYGNNSNGGGNIAVEMRTPVISVSSTVVSGGDLEANYDFYLFAKDVGGNLSSPSAVKNCNSAGTPNACSVTWSPIPGSVGFKLYYQNKITSSWWSLNLSNVASFTLAQDQPSGVASESGLPAVSGNAYVNKFTADGFSWINGGNLVLSNSGKSRAPVSGGLFNNTQHAPQLSLIANQANQHWSQINEYVNDQGTHRAFSVYKQSPSGNEYREWAQEVSAGDNPTYSFYNATRSPNGASLGYSKTPLTLKWNGEVKVESLTNSTGAQQVCAAADGTLYLCSSSTGPSSGGSSGPWQNISQGGSTYQSCLDLATSLYPTSGINVNKIRAHTSLKNEINRCVYDTGGTNTTIQAPTYVDSTYFAVISAKKADVGYCGKNNIGTAINCTIYTQVCLYDSCY